MRAGTTARTTRWHVVIELAHRKVVVYRQGRVMRRFAAVVGKPSTPTPHGQFFVEEAIALPSGEVGAPFALALSARSNVFQEFDGGPGQIALHGLAHVGGTPGTAVSHGCVRLTGSAMTWLVARIGPGVPVTIAG
jgi:lipoprotein-anchoring transpeptidase ErfK/SrfK